MGGGSWGIEINESNQWQTAKEARAININRLPAGRRSVLRCSMAAPRSRCPGRARGQQHRQPAKANLTVCWHSQITRSFPHQQPRSQASLTPAACSPSTYYRATRSLSTNSLPKGRSDRAPSAVRGLICCAVYVYVECKGHGFFLFLLNLSTFLLEQFCALHCTHSLFM